MLKLITIITTWFCLSLALPALAAESSPAATPNEPQCPHLKQAGGECPHLKQGEKPADCPHLKAGDCPHLKAGGCPHAKGDCPCKGEKGEAGKPCPCAGKAADKPADKPAVDPGATAKQPPASGPKKAKKTK